MQLVTIRCVAKGCSWRWIVSCTSEPNHNTKLQQLLILKLKIHKCTKTHEYSKFSSAQLRRKFNLFACHFGCFDLELRPSLWLRPDSVQTHPRVTLNEKYPRGRFVTRLRLICSFEEKVPFNNKDSTSKSKFICNVEVFNHKNALKGKTLSQVVQECLATSLWPDIGTFRQMFHNKLGINCRRNREQRLVSEFVRTLFKNNGNKPSWACKWICKLFLCGHHKGKFFSISLFA